jgi:glutathione synthetase
MVRLLRKDSKDLADCFKATPSVYSVDRGELGFVGMSSYDAVDRMADSPKKLRTLIYIDKPALNNFEDSTRYLGMAIAGDRKSQVYFATEKDESLAQNADIVFMRMDPPLDYKFSRAFNEYDDGFRTFVNPPAAQRYLANKGYLKDLISLGVLPGTLISKDLNEISDFAESLDGKYLIVKPVVGFGGDGVFRINRDDFNGLERAVKCLSKGGKKNVVVQDYINEVGELGDKRVFLVDGQPVGCALRLPQKGSFLANVKKGGSVVKSELTPNSVKIK